MLVGCNPSVWGKEHGGKEGHRGSSGVRNGGAMRAAHSPRLAALATRSLPARSEKMSKSTGNFKTLNEVGVGGLAGGRWG